VAGISYSENVCVFGAAWKPGTILYSNLLKIETKWFQGRRLKGETLTDDGHHHNVGRKVIAIAQTMLP
jgi:hypothetical protein